MLAVSGELPVGPAWAYEYKWDGIRAVGRSASGRWRLASRTGREITTAFPELDGLAREVPDAVLDGELISLDDAGRVSFGRIIERMHTGDPAQVARLVTAVPATYIVFDLLWLDGNDLRGLPYTARRELLEDLELSGPAWQTPGYLTDGPTALDAAMDNALEGVVAKRRDSPYRPGVRSRDWIKVKPVKTVDLVVGGWRRRKRELGALLVGEQRADGRLRFRGRVGGGIGVADETRLLAALRPLVADDPPFATGLSSEDRRGATWVRPDVVVELDYGTVTDDGRLRFPRFRRMRPDKTPEQTRNAFTA
ncbi:non-homologous end-joining DNA ligase [Stackebrandtia albiflava]